MSLIKANITAENLQNICKICLEEKTPLISLCWIIEFLGLNISPIRIDDVLRKVTAQVNPAETSDPKGICYDCLHEMKVAYLFMLKCEEAEKILRQFLATHEEKKEESKEFVNECLDSDSQVPYQTEKRGRKKLSQPEGDETSNETQLHQCPICYKHFTALALRDHAHTHKALKKYLNIPADKKVTPSMKFSTTRQLSATQKTIFKRAERLHKCPYCNLEFPVDKFTTHVDEHWKQSEFKCDKCDRVFTKLRYLNLHRWQHLKEYPYKCKSCGKEFVVKTNYDCHILTHTNEELPHECRYCLKRFSNLKYLKRHQLIHSKNDSCGGKYQECRCHQCLKTFKDGDELKQHVCERDRSTGFSCKSCNKVFKYSSGLNFHNRKIHKIKGRPERGPRALCSVCGKYVFNIHSHMIAHSGVRQFQCDQCEKKFLRKPQLTRHLLVHSGLKLFICSVCAKAFNNLQNLQVHERTHTGEKCHICNICNKRFLEKSYLKKHMNVHAKV